MWFAFYIFKLLITYTIITMAFDGFTVALHTLVFKIIYKKIYNKIHAPVILLYIVFLLLCFVRCCTFTGNFNTGCIVLTFTFLIVGRVSEQHKPKVCTGHVLTPTSRVMYLHQQAVSCTYTIKPCHVKF